MKNLSIIGITFLFLLISSSAHAIPAFPRDLKCETSSSVEITLVSNNSLWAQAQNGRYHVELIVDGGKEMEVVWNNNRASHTRGNDQGVREYIFVSEQGEEFYVMLEFHAPFGQAKGIKNFLVRSSQLQFQHSQRTLSSDVCNVTFYQRTEI